MLENERLIEFYSGYVPFLPRGRLNPWLILLAKSCKFARRLRVIVFMSNDAYLFSLDVWNSDTVVDTSWNWRLNLYL